jgi:ligand-binding sensor domain-containing protein
LILPSFYIRKFLFREILLCAGILFFISGNSQFNQIRNYNVKEGLPSSDVYAMMQDASGYIWFTTDMGVSRFNGYEFKNFTTENGLADNTNFGLIQDAKGRIWFRSFSGRLSYFENEQMKTPVCNAVIQKLLESKSVTSLYVDEKDTIWAGLNGNEILKIAPPWKNENAKIILLPSSGAFLIFFPQDHFIFGGSSPNLTDLNVFDKNFRNNYTIPIQVKKTGTGYFRYNCFELKDHTFVFTADNVIIRFNSSGIISQKTCRSKFICLLEENDQVSLAGTYDGLNQFSDYSFENPVPMADVGPKIITGLCYDNENGLWVATEGNGIYYFPFGNFLYYTPANGLSESRISCVAKADGKVFCGHLDGSISILKDKSVKSIRINTDTSGLSSANRTTSIMFNGNHELYISTTRSTFSFNILDNSVQKKCDIGSKVLLNSRDQKIWSLNFNELLKFTPDKKFEPLKICQLNFYSDNLFEDHSGKIWICSNNNIWTYDSLNGLLNPFQDIPELKTRIVDVKEDADGNIWMVSRGKGVIVKKENSYFTISQKEGLVGNMCRTVFIDSGNVVWVGTNNGLSKIVLTPGKDFKYTVTNYTSKNGLLSNEVNTILRQGDKLWLVHNNGVSVFDPAQIGENASPPPVYITRLLVNNDTVAATREIDFPYDRNYFNISFIGISYKDPGHVEYKYKMKGVDSNWVYTYYTSVTYQTLPPGDYKFIVYAKNNDGYWSQNPATLSFTILPAWWQTLIFKTVVVLFLILIILFVFRIRINVIRQRDRKKSVLQNKIAGIELKALRAQMNPHFVFNSINSVQYFITNNDPDSSQKYLSKFAKLIRYVVDNSKLTFIPVKKEIEALTLYLDLEALRFGSRFEYNITVHENVDVEYTQIPSMLIQPYVENSIWHGIMHKKGNGKIDITLEMKEDVLFCTIEDNGIGRKKSMELKHEKDECLHDSIGMSNTRERLEIINQVNDSNMSADVSDIIDEKGEICGTKVEIHVPVKDSVKFTDL